MKQYSTTVFVQHIALLTPAYVRTVSYFIRYLVYTLYIAFYNLYIYYVTFPFCDIVIFPLVFSMVRETKCTAGRRNPSAYSFTGATTTALSRVRN